VIHNGVDTTRFDIRDREACARELGLPEDRHRLLFVGHLAPVKGLPCLIEAFSRIAADRRGITLYIVGDGVDRASHERMVKARGLSSSVRFVGAEHPGRMPIWYGAAHLLCLPSLHEGCPNVVLEALACGRPVVASRVGGVPELLAPRAGLLVPPGDAEVLASALERALAGCWDAQSIRAGVLARSWGAAADAYCEVYERVICAHALRRAQTGVYRSPLYLPYE
jgi:glycosyltransferase involved in cell wall biosynthesis